MTSNYDNYLLIADTSEERGLRNLRGHELQYNDEADEVFTYMFVRRQKKRFCNFYIE